MVSLSTIKSSNALISSTFPRGLVALFVGATSGIGEITLKKFAKYSLQPRVYFIGRSLGAADRIVAECKALNPGGEYNFIKADVSLIRVVDEVCKEIKANESSINQLTLDIETSEHVHLLAALNYYSRLRFIINLLPLLRCAPSLRRVVTVGAGSLEGPIDRSDLPALHVPLPELRGHLGSLITLGLEAVAKTASEVSFIHDYPGTVNTPFISYLSEEQLKAYELVSVEDSGERHIFLATSAKFPAVGGQSDGVRLEDGVEVAIGSTGEVAGGLYSVGHECESASPAVGE